MRPPRGPQDGPQGPRDGPRGSQDDPNEHQEGPKTDPRGGIRIDISSLSLTSRWKSSPGIDHRGPWLP
eukprot:135768-Pyramimonas_sp.AAC.1